MNWYIQVLTKYAEFKGRARRSEYWYFVLVNFSISISLYVIDLFAGTFGLFGILYSIALLIPGLAVSIRRLHDTNRSGWNLLFALIPIIGVIVLLIFLFENSTEGNNRYGTNPKEIS